MKCVIRENLDKMKISVRKLAEMSEKDPEALSYSTIDNFIRKGTGNLDTAWGITKLMGLTLNDNFIDEESELDSKKTSNKFLSNLETTLKEISAKNNEVENLQILMIILFRIGKVTSTLGYDADAKKLFEICTEFTKRINEKEENGDE